MIALTAKPVDARALSSDASSRYSQTQSTSVRGSARSPPRAANRSSAPASESANGPGALRGGGGSSAPTSLTYAAASHCSGRPHVAITTGASAVPTRAASASARPGSAANWNELKPVTTSKDRSAKGSCSISPTTSSAPGVRSRAISIIGAAASRPLTSAPRCSASFRNRPAPHPTSSSRVPPPISSSSRTAS